jgi:hypothetical protein
VLTTQELGENTQARFDKAKQHYDAYSYLDTSSEHLEWVVTALFYSAAMIADAHALEIGKLPISEGNDW